MNRFFSVVGSLVLLTSLTAAAAQGEKTPDKTPDIASGQALEKAPAPKSAAPKPPSKSWSWDLLLAGQAIGLADFDGEGKPAFGVSTDEPFEMNVRRVSAMFKARALEVLKFKVHLLSMPAVSSSALDVADLHMAVEPHPAFGIKVGRFKKGFTDVYTPFWATWRFFDVPGVFKYVKGNMGLAGRGEGVLAYGGVWDKKLRYSVGVFNGLEESKSWKKGDKSFHREDESVEAIGRVELDLGEAVTLGGGVAYMPESNLVVETTTPEGETSVSESESALLAYSGNAVVDFWNFELAAEYIGHRQSEKNGGGVFGDLSYTHSWDEFALRPAFRYAVHIPDYDNTDALAQQMTGALNFHYAKTLRVGLEVSQLKTQEPETDRLQGLLQVAFVYK